MIGYTSSMAGSGIGFRQVHFQGAIYAIWRGPVWTRRLTQDQKPPWHTTSADRDFGTDEAGIPSCGNPAHASRTPDHIPASHVWPPGTDNGVHIR